MQTKIRRMCLVSIGATIGFALLTSDATAQRGGPFGGGPFGRGGGMEILFQDSVRNEIELVDEQEQQLRELFGSMREGMQSVFEEIRDLPREERREAMMARMQEQQDKLREQMNEILLPHQVERLEQLMLQRRFQGGNAADALASSDIREKLGLSDEQIALMRETAEEAAQELREKIQRANEEAREKVLAILTPEQRATWDQLMGDSFQFEEGGRFGRRGPGGGPGGPGGRFRGGPGRRDPAE